MIGVAILGFFAFASVGSIFVIGYQGIREVNRAADAVDAADDLAWEARH